MAEARIVDALGAAGGRRGGKLSVWHPADLAGEQSFHIGRNAVMASRLPDNATIDATRA